MDIIELVLNSSRFWIQRILIPIFVFIGVTGNAVSVMILTRRRMRSSTNVYLSALAVADIIHLLMVFLLSFKHYPNIHDRKYELYWRFMGIIYWLCDAASSTSVWVTVSFTAERYIAVCHPMKRKYFCTENRAKSIITLVYIFCLLTTASTTFEYQLTLEENCIRQCNSEDISKNNSVKEKLNGKGYNLLNKNNHSTATNHHRIVLNLNDTILNQLIDSNYYNFSTKFLKKYELQIQKEILSKMLNCHSNSKFVYLPYLFPIHENLNKSEEDKDSNLAKDTKKKNLKVLDISEPANEIENNLLNKTFCCLKKFVIDIESTSLGSNPTYGSFIHWYSAIFFGFLPLLLIATLNSFLIKAVYVSQKKRKGMISQQDGTALSNENRTTLMLIGVIILFLICQTPTSCTLIYRNFANASNEIEQHILLILGNIFNFLIVINSSCNFILYCLLSQKYRNTFRKIFCERKKDVSENSIPLATRKNSSRYGNTKPKTKNFPVELSTPRNLEISSLSTIPRTTYASSRPVGKARSDDLVV